MAVSKSSVSVNLNTALYQYWSILAFNEPLGVGGVKKMCYFCERLPKAFVTSQKNAQSFFVNFPACCWPQAMADINMNKTLKNEEINGSLATFVRTGLSFKGIKTVIEKHIDFVIKTATKVTFSMCHTVVQSSCTCLAHVKCLIYILMHLAKAFYMWGRV